MCEPCKEARRLLRALKIGTGDGAAAVLIRRAKIPALRRRAAARLPLFV